MHYTSFINENPIPISDIAQMQKQALMAAAAGAASSKADFSDPVARGMVAAAVENPPLIQSNLPDSGAQMQAIDSVIVNNSGIEPMESMAGVPEAASSMDTQEDDGQAIVITEEQINAALQALVEAGENLPEGAEIMVQDNTLYVDGIPKVVISAAAITSDGQSSEDAAGHMGAVEPTIEDFATQDPSSMMNDNIEVAPPQMMSTEEIVNPNLVTLEHESAATVEIAQPVMEQHPPLHTSEQDFLTSHESTDDPQVSTVVEAGTLPPIPMDASSSAEFVEAVTATAPPEGSAAFEEEYIALENLDLSNVDLPPGNYNLVIDEQGQAVFVPTEVIDENTIQIVAQ